jgi:hypothetical protein
MIDHAATCPPRTPSQGHEKSTYGHSRQIHEGQHRRRSHPMITDRSSKLGFTCGHHQQKQRDEPQGSRSCQGRGDPGTNRVQTTSPNTSQRQPLSTNVSAAHRPSRPPKPWSASPQRRYISKRSATEQNALAGRADLRDDRPPARARLGRVRAGCGIPSTSPRATTRRPGGRATRHRRRSHRGLPPGRRVVGLTPGRRDATQLPACKIISGCQACLVRSETRNGTPPGPLSRFAIVSRTVADGA